MGNFKIWQTETAPVLFSFFNRDGLGWGRSSVKRNCGYFSFYLIPFPSVLWLQFLWKNKEMKSNIEAGGEGVMSGKRAIVHGRELWRGTHFLFFLFVGFDLRLSRQLQLSPKNSHSRFTSLFFFLSSPTFFSLSLFLLKEIYRNCLILFLFIALSRVCWWNISLYMPGSDSVGVTCHCNNRVLGFEF